MNTRRMVKSLLIVLALIVLVFGAIFIKRHFFTLTASSSDIYSAINAERAKNGLPALIVDSRLVISAQNKCNDLIAKNYYAHKDPNGDAWHFIKEQMPTYHIIGENIGATSVSEKAMITAWINSPKHRANILNKEYTATGVGVCSSKDYSIDGHKHLVLAVQHFAKP